MSTIFVIRHAQASFGQSVYDKLSDKGISQSRILAGHLNRSGIIFDVIYTGTMKRHIETQEIYSESLAAMGKIAPPVIRTPDLNEYDSQQILTALIPELLQEDASWQKHVDQIFASRKSFQFIFETIMQRWIAGSYANSIIENWENYNAAIYRAIDDILAKHGRGKNIGIYTSGGPVAAFVMRALNLSRESLLAVTWQVVNASITRFKSTQENMMLSTFNEYSHFELCDEKDMVTYR